MVADETCSLHLISPLRDQWAAVVLSRRVSGTIQLSKLVPWKTETAFFLGGPSSGRAKAGKCATGLTSPEWTNTRISVTQQAARPRPPVGSSHLRPTSSQNMCTQNAFLNSHFKCRLQRQWITFNWLLLYRINQTVVLFTSWLLHASLSRG